MNIGSTAGLGDLSTSETWGNDLDCSQMFDVTKAGVAAPAQGWSKRAKVLKQKFLFEYRGEEATKWLRGRLPEPGEDLVCISTGRWDYWHFPLSILTQTKPGAIREIYVSTWAFNRETLKSFAQQLDRHKCKAVFMITSFNADRYPAEHYLLTQTVAKYNGSLIALNQHSKIFLIAAPPNYYSMTGSANMTKNENIEQTTITNDKDRFLFYRAFFQHFMKKHERSDYTD